MKSFQRDSLALKVKLHENQFEFMLLDQTTLPNEEKWIKIHSTDQMIEAIKQLRVRGAPLIGVAASMMLAQRAFNFANPSILMKEAELLYEARPTAVNLMFCVNRIKKIIEPYLNQSVLSSELQIKIINEALNIFDEDYELCEKMADNGVSVIHDGDQILTHCNTGGLATAGIGTALGVIRKAHEQGKKIHVYVDETRPLLQGGRLTAWELMKLGIPCTLITDNMAAQLMSLKKINKAFVGSDRIARNGDFANKIGTYSVAVNCHYHKIPFYVVAPYTTVDLNCDRGDLIPIEQRISTEVTGVSGSFGSVQWAPPKVNVYNPSFDVTPAELVTGWILDKGHLNQNEIKEGKLVQCLA